MFSSTELLPLDCDPTTAICGRSIGFWTYYQASAFAPQKWLLCSPCGSPHTPTVVKTSCSLLTRVISPGSLTLILESGLSAVRCQSWEVSQGPLTQLDSSPSPAGSREEVRDVCDSAVDLVAAERFSENSCSRRSGCWESGLLLSCCLARR